ncbi:MAG TPA: hypothetical protein PK997_03100 [Candidatus Omnitrophota bacterium]|jgi:hypothetical protein|nr:hypothetical protein [Candidatus Omnitrophota bacterium]HQB94177.1 hypothetical protein [Candidatus Omnitrophota bacterium]
MRSKEAACGRKLFMPDIKTVSNKPSRIREKRKRVAKSFFFSELRGKNRTKTGPIPNPAKKRMREDAEITADAKPIASTE